VSTCFSGYQLRGYQLRQQPVLKPTVENNEAGIFTGCMYPTAPDGSPGLSIFYTSVTKLPIHWTLPHTHGAEGLSLISSSDGGKTCERDTRSFVIG
jgi:beta-fructofuranosidase